MWTKTVINLIRRISGTKCNDEKKLIEKSKDIPLLEKLAENRVRGLHILYAVNKNLPEINLYPTIGLHSKNETVMVNLGQNPFVYNIKMEMKHHQVLHVSNSLQVSDCLTDWEHGTPANFIDSDFEIFFKFG